MYSRNQAGGWFSAADTYVQHSDSGGGSSMSSRGEPYRSSHAGSQGGREFFHDRQSTGGSDKDFGNGRYLGNSEGGGLYKGRGRGDAGVYVASDRESYGSSKRRESDYNQGRDSYSGRQREVSSHTDQQMTKGYFSYPERNEGDSYMDQQRRKGTYDDGRNPSIDSREKGGPYRQGSWGGSSLPDFQKRDEFNQGKTSYMDSRERVGPYQQRGEGSSGLPDFQKRDKGFNQAKASYLDSRESVGPYKQVRGGGGGSSFSDFEKTNKDFNPGKATYLDSRERVEPYKQGGRGGRALSDFQRKEKSFTQGKASYTDSHERGGLYKQGGAVGMSSDFQRRNVDFNQRRGEDFNQRRDDNFNAPYIGGVNKPFMNPQRGLLNTPVMDSQRGLLNTPVMNPQRGLLNTPVMNPQRGLLNTPIMNPQRGLLNTPVMDQNRSGWREMPVSTGPTREEQVIKEKSYLSSQPDERDASCNRWGPYPSQWKNQPSQAPQVRHLDSVERAAAQPSNVMDRIGKRNVERSAAQPSNVMDRLGKRITEVAIDYEDYDYFAPANKMAKTSVHARLGPQSTTPEFSKKNKKKKKVANVEAEEGGITGEEGGISGEEGGISGEEGGISSEIGAISGKEGGKFGKEGGTFGKEVFGINLRRKNPKEVVELAKQLNFQLPKGSLHCDVCKPYIYKASWYEVKDYLRHHFTQKHIRLEKANLSKINVILSVLKCDAKLGYVRVHGMWSTKPETPEMCEICSVPMGEGENDHMEIRECWINHEYAQPKNCCFPRHFVHRHDYFFHCYCLTHLMKEGEYRRVTIWQQTQQKNKLKRARKEKKTAGHEVDIDVNFKNSLVAMEAQIEKGFGMVPVPKEVKSLFEGYKKRDEISRPKKTNTLFQNNTEVQFMYYDPFVAAGKFQVIFETQFECSLCYKEMGRSPQSVIDHCATREHHDSLFNQIRRKRGLVPFTVEQLAKKNKLM